MEENQNGIENRNGIETNQDQEKNDVATVEVKFVTKLPSSMQVTDQPFRVPAELARFGLSGVINHLLNLGEKKHLFCYSK